MNTKHSSYTNNFGYWLLAGCLLWSSCQSGSADGRNTAAHLSTTSDVPTDFPLLYAQNFSIEQKEGYQLLTVSQAFAGDKSKRTYAAYPRDNRPKELASQGADVALALPVPLRRIVCLSTTHAAYLEALGVDTLIVGATYADRLYSTKLRQAVAQGRIKNLGAERVNAEAIFALEPEVVFISEMGGESNLTRQLTALGIPVVAIAEYTEATPLGRAEWLRFFGLLTDKKEEADSLYRSTVEHYEALLKLPKGGEAKPTVLVGNLIGGTWYLPAGNSFVARYIADAGGDYLWAETEGSVSLALAFEAVFAKAKAATIWLDAGIFNSKNAMLKADRRYALFEAFENDAVYNYTARVSPQGGYDIYESALVHPDKVLKDLIAIFYPDFMPEHQLYYYERLSPTPSKLPTGDER